MSITSGDARRLTAEALEVLRRRAVAAVEAGVSRAEVARTFGVSRKTVGRWVVAYQENGEAALRPRSRGRRPGEQLALSPEQQAWTIKAIVAGTPDNHDLAYRLWTRQAVAELVNRRFRITLSTTTVTHYLNRWGLIEEETRLREMMRARVMTVLPVQRSKYDDDDPWIPGAEVLWLAWMRPHDPDIGRGGPVAAGRNLLTGFRTYYGDVNVMFAVSKRGVLFFLAGVGPFGVSETADFLLHLASQLGRALNVIVCQWPAQHREVLRTAANEGHLDRISIRYALNPG
jgi:transposase